ncbi:LEC14B-like, partial [Glycine soja]
MQSRESCSSSPTRLIQYLMGSHIRIYNVDRGWKVQKNILAKNLRWTITDTSLSPDQRYLVYASMSPIVHIVNAGSAETESLANVTSDVNTVRFADETSHLIYSGSDDSFCKASQQGFKWDTLRALHLLIPEEMDFISFQMVKIKRSNFGTYAKCHPMLPEFSLYSSNPGYRSYEWDYRWMDYPPQAKDLTHPCDQSVATYRGHSVLRTLIRCYFSPAFSTGQKYIYTGSHHACVYIYDLVSGAQVATLKHHKSPVRDCSWHPFHTTLVSSSWDGDVVKWEFAGSGDTPASSTKKRLLHVLFGKFNPTLPNLSSFFLFFSHLLFTMMIPCRHTRKHTGRKKSLSRPKTQKAYYCNAERDTAIVGSTPTRAYGKLKKAEET